jgi:chromosome segregation ATPase
MEDMYGLESVKRKFETLDSELNVFLKSIREIKEIRDSVEELPERLKQNKQEIENQKKDLERLMTSTNNLLMTFEEQSKGIIFDLEKKTEALTNEVKSSLSQISNLFKHENIRLPDVNKEALEELSKRVKEIKIAYDSLKEVVESHEQTINLLKDNYMTLSKVFERIEPSIVEMKRNISELQERPHEVESNMKELEKRLKDIFFENLDRQKKVILFTLSLLIGGIIFYLFSTYFK